MLSIGICDDDIHMLTNINLYLMIKYHLNLGVEVLLRKIMSEDSA